MNGWVRNNDAFTAGRAVAHLTHASQKVGGRSGDILGRSGRHTGGKSAVNSMQIGTREANEPPLYVLGVFMELFSEPPGIPERYLWRSMDMENLRNPAKIPKKFN